MDAIKVNKHVKRLLRAAECVLRESRSGLIYEIPGETYDFLMDWRKIGEHDYGRVGSLTPDECVLFILFVVEAEFGE